MSPLGIVLGHIFLEEMRLFPKLNIIEVLIIEKMGFFKLNFFFAIFTVKELYQKTTSTREIFSEFELNDFVLNHKLSLHLFITSTSQDNFQTMPEKKKY